MKISVIIPTYKPQAYIWECLKSLKAQTINKDWFEIILILNGCNEPYFSQIQSFINTHLLDFHIDLIQTNQGGVSNARNIGLDKAKGEYITFIDDDDYVSPDYLLELYKVRQKYGIAISDALSFEDGTTIYDENYSAHQTYLRHNRTKPTLCNSRKMLNGPCLKLIARDVIGSKRFDLRFKNGEDSLFMFAISDKIKTISYTSNSAIYYRRYRKDSAYFTQSISYKLRNAFRLSSAYTSLMLSHPQSYDVKFYFTRIFACIHSILK